MQTFEHTKSQCSEAPLVLQSICFIFENKLGQGYVLNGKTQVVSCWTLL